MKKGDLVKIKEIYHISKWEKGFHVVLDTHIDDDGYTWIRLHPRNGDLVWLQDYKIEVINETR